MLSLPTLCAQRANSTGEHDFEEGTFLMGTESETERVIDLCFFLYAYVYIIIILKTKRLHCSGSGPPARKVSLVWSVRHNANSLVVLLQFSFAQLQVGSDAGQLVLIMTAHSGWPT